MITRDLTDPRLMSLKASLFVGIGIGSVALILIEHPSLRLGVLLMLAIWAFARAYYFAFYVIEHYIDAEYRYTGLGSFVAYVLACKRRGSPEPASVQTAEIEEEDESSARSA